MEARIILPKGVVLDTSYRIERLIGSGGFGLTYEAADEGLGRPVAIKEFYPAEIGARQGSVSVRPRTDADRPIFEKLRQSFVREARTLSQLRHPAIVRVLRVFEAHGTAYMVMDLEDGPTLKSWLLGLQRKPSQTELDRLVAPLLGAVDLIHTQGFVHRDIAPDNIIVRPDGTPVLLDFGATRRVLAELTSAVTGLVKRGYSPMEQYAVDARAQGPWSDVYALGATLYRCVTGAEPEESTLRMLEDKQRTASSLSGTEYRAQFLAGIDAAMALRPEDRPQSVEALGLLLLPLAEARERLVAVAAVDGASISTMPASNAEWPATSGTSTNPDGGSGTGPNNKRPQSISTPTPAVASSVLENANPTQHSAVRRPVLLILTTGLLLIAAAVFAIVRQDRGPASLSKETAPRDEKSAVLSSTPPRSTSTLPPPDALPPLAEASAKGVAGGRLASEKPAADNCTDGLVRVSGKGCLKPGDTFKDCETCPEMIVVPAGEFQMGSPGGEADRSVNEGPRRTVRFARPFAIGRFETTRGQFDELNGKAGIIVEPGCTEFAGRPAKPTFKSDLSHEKTGFHQTDSHPVVCVNWKEAQSYVAALTISTGFAYRLPTEAEWEYSARAGTEGPYFFGTDAVKFCEYANVASTEHEALLSERPLIPCNDGASRTQSVGHYKPNAFGLHDTIGNVWEWTQDCWSPTYWGAPDDGSARSDGNCTLRIARGGGWGSIAPRLRVATRWAPRDDLRTPFVGFRVARSID